MTDEQLVRDLRAMADNPSPVNYYATLKRAADRIEELKRELTQSVRLVQSS